MIRETGVPSFPFTNEYGVAFYCGGESEREGPGRGSPPEYLRRQMAQGRRSPPHRKGAPSQKGMYDMKGAAYIQYRRDDVITAVPGAVDRAAGLPQGLASFGARCDRGPVGTV